MKKVNLYTDGACSGNPGPGGWGSVLEFHFGGELHRKELKGGEPESTNNRMEMRAVIEGLRILKESCQVTLTTDSSYVKDGITKWIHGWKRNGWKTAAKKPVKNKEIWLEMLEQCERHKIEWKWIKGHSGHLQNERCDTLATSWVKDFKEGRI